MEKILDQADSLRRIGANMNNNLDFMMNDTKKNIGHFVRVISISSGKGGVGKTSITANLAYELSKRGQRVVILDADLGLANIDILLGLTSKYNIKDVILGEKSLKEILIDAPGGFKVLPASSGITELTHLDLSQRMNFMEDIEELNDDIDIMLIDNAAGISDNVLYFNVAAQEQIIVITPEPTSITDAYALIKILVKKYDEKSFLLLINQTKSEKEALTIYKHFVTIVERFLGSLSLDYLGYIPKDEKVSKAIRQQKPLLACYPGALASIAIKNLAASILNLDTTPKPDGNIRFFWKKLLEF